MFVKILIILMLLAIVYTLGSAFWFMVKDSGKGDRTVWRLTWRIGLSMALLIAMWIMYQVGWLEPTGRGPIGLEVAPTAAERGDGP